MAIANAYNRFTLISILVLLISFAVPRTSGIISPPRPKNVHVSLEAKWSSTSFFLEADELLSKYRDDYFWKFLDLWKPPPTVDPTDEACFNSILDVANSVLDGPLQSVFQLSLLLRSASPKLVVYRQLAEESLLQHRSSVEPDCHGPPDGDLQQCEPLKAVESFKSSCCWADTGKHVFFTEFELKQWLDSIQQSKEHETSEDILEIFEFDHVFPQSGSSGRAIVLYSAPGTSCFEKFHSLLADAAKSGLIKYVLRPFLAPDCDLGRSKCVHMGSINSLHLGGYGIELALKNMEYKAMDDSDVKKSDVTDEVRADDLSQEVKGFIFSKLLERKPGLSDDLLTFRDHLLSSSVSDTMNVWELKDLGYQAAQRIIHASEPLHVMQEINQNFPNLVSSISRLKLNDTIKDEIVDNQRMVNPGKSLMAINGALINIEDLDLYSLVELVLGELSLADVISKMKVPSKYTKSLMQIPDPTEQTSFRVDFRSPHVQYLNNLEEDAMYRRWRSNLQELLMPVFPGQMRYIKKNLFNSIYIIDPASPAGLKVIDNILYCFENNVPMRFGILLFSPTALETILSSGGELSSVDTRKDLSSLAGKLFLYVKDNYGAMTAYQFLSKINEMRSGDFDNQNENQVELVHIEEAFFDIVKPRAKIPPQEILLKLEEGSQYDQSVLESTMFVYKLGLHHKQPCFIMNGMVRGSTTLQDTITAMNEELPKIQEGVYFGHITSNTDVLDKFLKENGYSRYNPQIVSTSKESLKYVSLAKAMTGEYPAWLKLRFLHSPGTDDDVKPITHLLSVDISSHQGLKLLQQAARYLMKESKRGRVGALFNIRDISICSQASPTHLFARIVMEALEASGTSSKIVPFLDKFLSWYVIQTSGTQNSIPDLDVIIDKASQFAATTKLKLSLPDGFVSDSASIEDFHHRISEHTQFLSTVLGLQSGSNAVLTNGKLFIQSQNHEFVAEDFALLESVEYDRRVKPVDEIIEKVDWTNIQPDDLTSDFLSSVIMGISSAIALRSRGSDVARFDMLQAEFSAIIHESENANIHVDAIVDPLSSVGQKLTPFFLILHEWFGASMRILLNPMSSLADLPLKNFYRFVVPSRHPFNIDGSFKPGPFALFSNMPPTRTLTMNLDVPEPWLVEPIKAVYDLDNILLEKLGSSRTMYAVFELEALMLTGHCYEQNNGPPRGLQLLLGTKFKPHMVDTIVMANLGYWQLKAGPGVWNLSLAPGRSSELYTFHGIGEGEANGPLSKQVVIKDLRGDVLHLEVVKRKGKEDETVLSADEEADDDNDYHNKKNGWNKDLFKWATDLLGGNKKQSEGSAQNEGKGRIIKRHGETINIFSIASGHLYERFLKIMMLSVLKNTQRPVKFWFIKNYLSPQFKDFIPHMAEEYGFEYELITYKWPTWLHKQTEKQRIIWAYKILFLDVIFPLSLRKVIFVDADQIVRADMGELYDMNLKGRPLAYTPFCDNNKEMDGYRFWNQGFWRDHLRGRPYHISALYVVDLVKFRQTAAGDNLRVFYETLSKDPGSLSNLDQDLPNYAQHQVPIFSLPQEWLWCESWCGNATKAKAKTIDLCNNPMTKEPKLQGARRIVAEWPALDEEARELTTRVLGDQGEAGLPSKLEPPVSQSNANDDKSNSESAAEL